MESISPFKCDGWKVGNRSPKHVFFANVSHSPNEQDTILYVSDLFTKVEKPTLPPSPISVSEVSKRISDALEGRIGRIDVVGQVNSPRLGNHWYFSLTDGDSKIDCVMWASSVSAIASTEHRGWKPDQGDQVIVRGTVGHYAKFGNTQIVVQRIKPVGDEKGKLQLEYEALLKEYREAGWFDEEHKKSLPKYPRKIAVITSATSAALQDVIETTRRRMPSVELLVVNAVMQGDASPESVALAIERVDACAEELGVDALIVTRGGGGLEELWSFNNRRVVEATFHCNTPLVAAIGHESDTSIIELVADHRASTPTQATMVLVPDKEELDQMIDHYSSRLSSVLSRSIERSCSSILQIQQYINAGVASYIHERFMQLATQSELLTSKRPHAQMQARQQRLLTLQTTLSRVASDGISQRSFRLNALRTRLESIGPMEVLGRGYSLTQDSSGKVVRTSKDVKEGELIRTVLADGTIQSKVECTS
jgi:exodeoxyribonuclease VII large subunit